MKNKAFTLIELLVVFSLIGIMIGVSLVAYSSTRKSARDGKRKADLEQIRSALEMYRSDVGSYPANLTFGGSLSYGSDVYMALIPNDPLSPTYKYVYSRPAADSYSLCAYLETSSGDAGCGSCGPGNCNYKVTNP
jgi:general secretion pathway protein G